MRAADLSRLRPTIHPRLSPGRIRTMATTTATLTKHQPVLTIDSINPAVREAQYAVRGELAVRAQHYADRLRKALDEGKTDHDGLPFDSVVYCNIGNPQQQPALAQPPLTFWRQVAALTELPELMNNPTVASAFPSDAIQRAKDILDDVGSVGAYSQSMGAHTIREHVAEYISGTWPLRSCSFISGSPFPCLLIPRTLAERITHLKLLFILFCMPARDGHPASADHIFLTAGASAGIQLILQVLIASPQVGVAIPIPQYPLYSATLRVLSAETVRYQLNPNKEWELDVPLLASDIDKAHAQGTDVRGLVVINPGNPTGISMTYNNIADVLRLAHQKRLVVFADEVYQPNIYTESRPFISFKKVLMDFAHSSDPAERAIAHEVELASFHSISKGFAGECGRRGGYFELTNFDRAVQAEIYKMASISLCPPVQGQIGVDIMVNPPKEGSPSFPLWTQERDSILNTLIERSRKMQSAFHLLPRMQCGEAQGSMYLFPEVDLPAKAVQAAEEAGRKSDEFYCFSLLDATGICVIPGSGFGKDPTREGRMFFRTTFLAKESDAFVERFSKFHREFIAKYE